MCVIKWKKNYKQQLKIKLKKSRDRCRLRYLYDCVF